MKDDKDRIEEQKQANVSDGDTRPDRENNGRPIRNRDNKKQPVTRERGADINTLEDFKDAK